MLYTITAIIIIVKNGHGDKNLNNILGLHQQEGY